MSSTSFSGPRRPRDSYDALRQIKSLNNFSPETLGITPGNKMLDALDLQTEVNTYKLLKVHITYMLFTLLMSVFLQISNFLLILHDFVEIVQIVCFIFQSESLNITNWWKIAKQTALVAYSVLYKSSSFCSPTSIRDFYQYIPANSCLPESITLTVERNSHSLPMPPDTPQPYLDGDKKVRIPSQQEMDTVVAVRNEYFTQYSTFIAAERMRLLSEISRFIFWTSLLPTTSFVNVYEPTGFLWKGSEATSVVEQLEMMSSLISNEFESFFNSSQPDLTMSMPMITITEMTSGTSLNVATLADLPEYESGSRQFKVYLSDQRAREVLVNDLAAKDFEILPPLSDLIIIPKRYSTAGFTALNFEDEVKTAQVYARNQHHFGFNLFFKALYYFAMAHDTTIPDNLSTTLTSIYLQPGHYLVKFFQRLRSLRLFDLKSSKSSLHENQ